MKLKEYINNKQKKILSVYFTAGFPGLDDTVSIINELEASGVDMIEVGVPYSDSLVDGPTIQYSNEIALANGMSLKKIFEDLTKAKETINIPLVLMSSLNPVLQYGIEKFVVSAKEAGISGLILPDLPVRDYEEQYKNLFEENDLDFCFLVTSNTSDERIKYLDSLSSGFIYAVSSESTTGNQFELDERKKSYFDRLNNLNLNNPFLVGFGIHDKATFDSACSVSGGAIIGSAFIKALKGTTSISESIKSFVSSIR